jgi:hypothetical protein
MLPISYLLVNCGWVNDFVARFPGFPYGGSLWHYLQAQSKSGVCNASQEEDTTSLDLQSFIQNHLPKMELEHQEEPAAVR